MNNVYDTLAYFAQKVEKFYQDENGNIYSKHLILCEDGFLPKRFGLIKMGKYYMLVQYINNTNKYNPKTLFLNEKEMICYLSGAVFGYGLSHKS